MAKAPKDSSMPDKMKKTPMAGKASPNFKALNKKIPKAGKAAKGNFGRINKSPRGK